MIKDDDIKRIRDCNERLKDLDDNQIKMLWNDYYHTNYRDGYNVKIDSIELRYFTDWVFTSPFDSLMGNKNE